MVGFRSNDLYVRVDSTDRLITVETGSASVAGIRVTGGGLLQSPDGTNLPPSSGETAVNPCLAFDTFIDLNANATPLGPLDFGDPATGGTIRGTWVSIAGVVGEQNLSRFGDNGYYVRVARLTAPTTVTDISGEILVAFIPSEGGGAETFTVPVVHCAECWDGEPPPQGTTGDGDTTPPTDDTTPPGDDTPPPGDDTTPPSDDTPPPGDDTTPPGDDTTPPGDDTTPPEDDTTPPDDGGGSEPAPSVFEAVWVVIENTCDDLGEPDYAPLPGSNTFDLYLRMSEPHRLFVLDSGISSSGLQFDGVVYNLEGARNIPPSQSDINAFPCAEFDSYFDAGGFDVSFLNEPSKTEWTSPLLSTWIPPLGVIAQGQQLFDDNLYYFRIMRLTVTADTDVSGEILALGTRFSGESLSAELVLPALP